MEFLSFIKTCLKQENVIINERKTDTKRQTLQDLISEI